jgi:aminopeptidase
MTPIYQKYAQLLVEYCLQVKEDDKVYIRSSYLAEPLLQEVLAAVARAGAHAVMNLEIQDQTKIIYDNASTKTLNWANPIERLVNEQFNCYLVIKAPFNLRDTQEVSQEKQAAAREGGAENNKIYMQRTGTYKLRRNLCQFPTQAGAQEAGMSLRDYEQFIFQSCNLFEEDPIQAWKNVGKMQQGIVDHLNKCSKVQYKGPDIDITFSCAGRTWINSDGKTNMPSGEVYTAPVENSVNGRIHFSLPSLYWGQEAENVILTVKDGEVVKWECSRGMELLDQVFAVPGARRFGEAAIGTNMNIQRMTKNILFDEKIGGTIHMAVGQSYPQCGGLNESAVHWDMITNMRNGGEIFADDELIYKNGAFLIS